MTKKAATDANMQLSFLLLLMTLSHLSWSCSVACLPEDVAEHHIAVESQQ